MLMTKRINGECSVQDLRETNFLFNFSVSEYKGVVISNKEGEHFLIVIEDIQHCCEFAEVEFSVLPEKFNKGIVIIPVDENHQSLFELMDLIYGLDDADMHSKSFIIIDNETGIMYPIYANNCHNGYYSHTVIHGLAGELEWDEL